MATAAYSQVHDQEQAQERTQDHTPVWAWGLDLLGLVAAISPGLIYVGYLLTQ